MVGENPRVQRTVSILRHGRMSPASVCFELVTIYHNDLWHNKGESHAHTRCCKWLFPCYLAPEAGVGGWRGWKVNADRNRLKKKSKNKVAGKSPIQANQATETQRKKLTGICQERERQMNEKRQKDEARYFWALGVSLFSSSPPSPPSFPYGNPCSSTELLGSSINQDLYEIPAGAKGQRRKLAAVFFLSFYVSRGANRQVRHQPHFHFKTNSPTGRGGAVCLLLHFMTHNSIGWRGGGMGWGGKGGGVSSPTPPSPPALPRSIVFRCVRANSGAGFAPFPSVDALGAAAAVTDDLTLAITPKVLPLCNEAPTPVNSGEL